MFPEETDWNGVASPRRHRFRKLFELTVERELGERIRADGAEAVAMWSALANVEWHHAGGGVVSYSFRSAGDLVAWLREDGDYLDWYCSGEPGLVSVAIAETLAMQGWTPSLLP